jgi:hypothetical protein
MVGPRIKFTIPYEDVCPRIWESIIKKLEDMKVLEMRPDDILILKLPSDLKTDEIDAIQKTIKGLQEDGCPLQDRKVVTICGEIEVGVLRPNTETYDGDIDHGK